MSYQWPQKKRGRKPRERTKLADGGRAPEVERSFAIVRCCAALLPGRGKLSRLVAFSVGPEASDSGREGERDGRRLVERDVGWELGPGKFRSQWSIRIWRTFSTSLAGNTTYSFNVERLLSPPPRTILSSGVNTQLKEYIL